MRYDSIRYDIIMIICDNDDDDVDDDDDDNDLVVVVMMMIENKMATLVVDIVNECPQKKCNLLSGHGHSHKGV